MLIRVKKNEAGGWQYIDTGRIRSFETAYGAVEDTILCRMVEERGGSLPKVWKVSFWMDDSSVVVVDGFFSENDLHEWLMIKLGEAVEGGYTSQQLKDPVLLQRLDDIEERVKEQMERLSLDLVV